MKYLITVVLSLLAVQAFADTKAYKGLKNGGEIVLTDESCIAASDMKRAYWYDGEGNTEDGCWKYDDRTIYFEWDNGGKSRYPKKKFRIANSW